MPRASKAVDAAKQLGRKVAAAAGAGPDSDKAPAGAAKSAPKRAAKPAKAKAKPVAEPAKAVAKAAKSVKEAVRPKTAKPGKAAPAKKGRATAKTVPAAKKAEKPAAGTAKAAKASKTADGDGFFAEQRALLEQERVTYLAQAADLKAEADQLAQEMEPGDIQFDDESGEGGTAAVDRERDLALSAQARIEVDEIDHALAKLNSGTYGICESCGQPIPRARLRALPHARLCVACKSGGLSRR